MRSTKKRKNLNLNPTGDPWSPWLHVDIALVFSSIVLAVIGAFMVYSATIGNNPELYDRSYLNRQLLFLGVGGAAMAAAAWSWVEKMLQDDQRTSAPNSTSVSISTAV